MKILFQILKESSNKGQDAMVLWEKHQSKCDCSSEDFTKPMLSQGNRIKMLKMGSRNKLQQKQHLTSSQQIIKVLARQLDRIIAKVPELSLQHIVVEDVSFEDCKCFISEWSKELKCLKSKNIKKVSYESFRNCSKGLNFCKLFKDETLTEDEKDFLLLIHILHSFPKSSVCQEGRARIELLNLYSQWKKGQLINILPIMDFILRTALTRQESVLKQKLQHVSTQTWKQRKANDATM